MKKTVQHFKEAEKQNLQMNWTFTWDISEDIPQLHKKIREDLDYLKRECPKVSIGNLYKNSDKEVFFCELNMKNIPAPEIR